MNGLLSEKTLLPTNPVMDETIFPAIKTLMRDLYNVDVKKEDNYWPLQRDPNYAESGLPADVKKTDNGETVGFDDLSNWKTLERDFVPRPTTKAEQGMTISRKEGAGGAIRMDAVETVDRHIRQAAHLLATQRDTKMLGEIARADWFKKRYGSLNQDFTIKYLDTVTRDSSPAGSTRTAWIDWMTKNTSTAIIGLRLLSQMKHAANIPFTLKNVRLDYLAKALAAAPTAEGRAFVAKNFSEIAQRYGGEPAIQDLSNGNIWRKIQGGSFVLERSVDALHARAAVVGRYMQELAVKGKDPNQWATLPVDQDAQFRAQLFSRQSVTSPLRKDVPQAISRGTLTGGQMSWSRAMFQFQNTMLRQYGYARHDIWDLGLKQLNFNQFATATLAFLAMIAGDSLIVKANKNLLHKIAGGYPVKDDNPVGKEAAAEVLRRIPIAGPMGSAALEYGQTGVPVVDTSLEGLKSAGTLLRDKNQYGKPLTEKQRKQEEIQVGGLAADVLGIPGGSTATQIMKQQVKGASGLRSGSRDPFGYGPPQ